MKKVLSFCFSCVIAVTVAIWFSASFAFANEGSDENPVYLALGDSITYGYTPGGGNLGEECFVNILASELDYEAINESVVGNEAPGVLEQLNSGSLDASIQKASIITLTCGGNDLMAVLYSKTAEVYNNSSTTHITADEVSDVLTNSSDTRFMSVVVALSSAITKIDQSYEFSAAVSAFISNLNQITSYIKDVNPNVKIYFATQYNPYEHFTTISSFTGYFAYCTELLRDKVLENSEVGQYTVADVYTAFKGNTSTYCYASDQNLFSLQLDFHPNAQGHKAIAQCFKSVISPSSVNGTNALTGTNATISANAFKKTLPALSTNAAKNKPATAKTAAVSESGNIVDWQTSNTCQWMIDASGALTIKPTEGTSGTLEDWSGNYAPWYSYASQITSVKVAATVSAQTAERMFYGCTNLKTVDLAGLDTQNATSMFAMFYNCNSLASTAEAPLNLSMLNTSKATSMAHMFFGCKALQTLSLKAFSTESVTDFAFMFDGCISLETLDVSSFNVANAKNLAFMFNSCAALESLNISNFEALRATSFSSMFAGCSSLKALDLSKMNTEDAVNMSSMFQGCTSLETLNLTGTFNTQAAENLQSMFNGCASLKTLDLTSFKTPKATTMQAMFQGCSGLVNIDISGFDTSKVTYFTSVFQGLSALESVNATGVSTANAASVARMFKGCASVETLDLSSMSTLKATNMASLFEGCSGLKKVQLGASFAFEGSTSAALCTLPAGKWVNSANQEFTESEIPSKTADTYTKTSEELDFAMFTVDTSAAKYSGNPVVGRVSSSTYEEGSDYKVEYANNINAGTATITITGIGTHTGLKTYNFQIERCELDFTKFTVDTKDVTYTGSAIMPAVAAEGYALNTDYTVTYANNTNVGKATITVAGAGNYTGSKEYTFEIVAQPDKPSEPDEPDETEKVTRLAGYDSAETAAAIAKEAFPEGVSSGWVVIARDDDFADAMSATGLAGALDAPILLTNRNELSSVTAQTVKDLGAAQAYIIGGTGAIPGDLESALKTQANCTVKARVFGTDAWDTSVECAKRIKEHGGNKTSEAIVAMGTNFQDALSISSFAYKYALPLFLETDANNGRCLTADAKAAVREAIGSTGTIYVPGGTGAVPSESVEGEFSGSNIVRMFGENGYDTSNQIATWMVKNNKLDASTICVANGSEAPKGTDALAGAALAGKRGGVMLLTNSVSSFGDTSRTTIDGTDSKNTPAFLKTNAKSISKAFVLGGTSVMPDAIKADISKLLGATS